MSTISGPAPGESPATSTMMPDNMRNRPIRTTRRGEARGASFGTSKAEASRVIDNGRSRSPVWSALRPSTTDKKSGMVKNTPAWMKNWKKNSTSPPVIWRLANMAGSNSGSLSWATRRDSHSMRAPMTSRPTTTSQKTSDTPAISGAFGFGWTHPQVPDRSTP